MEKSLVLTGMMGVGKSTVGNLLASKLKFKFLDIDTVIEKAEGASIGEIFENKGETYFREIEKKITLINIKDKKTVISLGGGAFIQNTIRREILKNSISFWLDLNIEDLINRNLKKINRPLLKNDSSGNLLNNIYSERKKIYNLANYKIKCESLNHKEIVSKILNIYENL